MSEPTPPASAPEVQARPVEGSERMVLLDVLRGFALCGVFISNSFTWFSGRNLLPREQAQAMAAPPLEAAVSALYHFFVNQKFVTLFSFLFGLGFTIQLARAEARGSPIVPLYSRRLLVLLGIGLAHLFGLWAGDVLSTYAVVGFVLLLFHQRSDRTVLAWVLVLLVAVPLLVPLIQRWGPILLHGAQAAAEAAKAREEHVAQMRARFLAGLSSDSFWTTQTENARYFLTAMLLQVNRLLWMMGILGRFLLGLLAGRHLLMQEVERNRPWHRRLLVWGLVLGVLGNGTGVVVQRLRLAGLVDPAKDAWMVAMPALQELGYLGLAAVYVAAFALLFQRERWRRGMQVLAPVGRMALTNYLLESVVSLCLYDGWGLGLVGRLPPSRCVALTLAVFALQVAFSHWWLSRLRFGPAEWLWRSLTYGRGQPMRLAPRSATDSAVS
ncbi:DUF418 domain-containing protein [Hyalangium sp.]|uniref:DUF418 domain-containing protein n=1 Tax=Hyalangium sp. TaxID=2028555 RepID=UPI002D2C51FE|nr:DUF418 domain-containing protein [Hyalangium sp.]HYH96442.1 DUF418 domain-containing protein [Hyalangium sp.]